jgi:hypothetical protein
LIERVHGTDEYEVACDYCSSDEIIDADDDWYNLIAIMKADGWRMTKRDKMWSHMCPECVAKGERW